MLIINANIKTMEEEDFANGYVAIADGKIQSVGPMSEAPQPDGEIYNAQGMTLYPGFIDAHCHLGMWEDGLGFEGDDGNEETDPVTPQLRAIDAINPLDRTFREAVEGGVTTVLTGPGSANPIGGQWAAIKTRGRRIDDMILKESVGMKFALGENPKNVYNDKNQAPNTRMATAALIREQLKKAQRYLENLERMENEDCDEPEYDMKCEALLPVLRKKQKAFFHAHRADDIFTAIRLSREFDLDLVLCHCTEGHLIADLLKEEGFGIIAGPILGDRSKPELRNLETSGLAKLFEAGIRSGLCTDHPETPIQYLPLCAGVAVGAGLNYEEALKSITIYPARIVGIDDRVGSIKPGKDADFVLYDGDPLSPYHHPKQVFVDGQKCL